MVSTQKYLVSLLAGSVLFTASSLSVASDEPTPIAIPTLSQAQVFAEFTDRLPAVVNYFTSATEAQIIEFYQGHYGAAMSQERKRGRLTLSYQQEQQLIRVVISQQNRKRQVDVIVEESNH